MQSIASILKNARRAKVVIPAFNVPYLPMISPITRAVADEDSFALIETARLEWIKFESWGLRPSCKSSPDGAIPNTSAFTSITSP